MTQKEFKKLTPAQQEEFLNSGEKFKDENLEQVEYSLASVQDSGTNLTEVKCDSLPTSPITTQPAQSFSSPETDFKDIGLDFKDPIELLFFADDDIASGRVVLHKWQAQILQDFALGGKTDKKPFQSVIRACNGSGKDKYIIAPCCVWLAMKFKDTVCPVTSSSGAQLDNQTCRYITRLCEAVNKKIGVKLWNCKYREYVFNFGDGSLSEIFCYATDEPGKAEGYHPTRFNARMGIFASEDKSIPDEINTALNRCSGYTHRLHASTPGLPMGHFFDYCSTAVNRDTVTNATDISPIDWLQYIVTYKDCSHISENYAEQIARDTPGGRNSAPWKSQFLAEFGTTDEMVVIPYTHIWKAFTSPPQWITEPFNTGGLDLSDGGAETALGVRNGNKLLKMIGFKFDNTEDTLDYLEEQFKDNNLNHKEALIFADCCGLGKPMLDSLKRRGWSNIRYVDSRHKARNPRVYNNVGTELFFNTRLLFERREIILGKDDVLVRQLSTRYYKILNSNIHQLLSKLEQRSRGYPSPDRADAFNLTFWNYKSNYKFTGESYAPSIPLEKREQSKPIHDFSLKEWSGSTKESLEAFRRKVTKRRNTERLQKELDRYTQLIK
jgi:hypothetical protein